MICWITGGRGSSRRTACMFWTRSGEGKSARGCSVQAKGRRRWRLRRGGKVIVKASVDGRGRKSWVIHVPCSRRRHRIGCVGVLTGGGLKRAWRQRRRTVCHCHDWQQAHRQGKGACVEQGREERGAVLFYNTSPQQTIQAVIIRADRKTWI
jgi:hypothetical protein